MKKRPRIPVVNPFVSEAQRRACYAAADPAWDCSEWSHATRKRLPDRVKRRHRGVTGNSSTALLRVDPTRTATIRRVASAAVSARIDLVLLAMLGRVDAMVDEPTDNATRTPRRIFSD